MTPEPQAYIATFDIHLDEWEFEQTVRFVTSRRPEDFLRDTLETWYDHRDDEQPFADSIAFLDNSVGVARDARYRAISLDAFDALDGVVHNSGDERAAWGGLVRKGGAR